MHHLWQNTNFFERTIDKVFRKRFRRQIWPNLGVWIAKRLTGVEDLRQIWSCFGSLRSKQVIISLLDMRQKREPWRMAVETVVTVVVNIKPTSWIQCNFHSTTSSWQFRVVLLVEYRNFLAKFLGLRSRTVVRSTFNQVIQFRFNLFKPILYRLREIYGYSPRSGRRPIVRALWSPNQRLFHNVGWKQNRITMECTHRPHARHKVYMAVSHHTSPCFDGTRRKLWSLAFASAHSREREMIVYDPCWRVRFVLGDQRVVGHAWFEDEGMQMCVSDVAPWECSRWDCLGKIKGKSASSERWWTPMWVANWRLFPARLQAFAQSRIRYH